MEQISAQGTRVLLLEDDTQTRHRFMQALQATQDLQLLAAFDNVRQTLQWLKQHSMDVLLADLGLPDGSGLDVIRYCNQYHSSANIMVLSIHEDAELVGRAIQAGATGYLLKDVIITEIGQKIRELRDGGAPMSPSIARQVLKHFQSSPQTYEKKIHTSVSASECWCDNSLDALTRREKIILTRMSEGFRYQEIANLEEISVHTVHAHIKKIYTKLNVHSRSEAIFEAVHMGLLEFRSTQALITT